MNTNSKLDVVANRLRHRSMGHVLFGLLVAFALAFMVGTFASSQRIPIARSTAATPAAQTVGQQIEAYTSAACGDVPAPSTLASHTTTGVPAC